LQTTRSTSFADSHEYSIDSSNVAALACCADEEGTEYECKKRDASDTFSYCQPKTSSPAQTTVTQPAQTAATQPAKTAEPAATEAPAATPAETPTDAAEETEDAGLVEIARLKNLLNEKENELLEKHHAPGKHGEDALPPVGHKGRHHGKHNMY
jgi:cell division septation protein DedD